MKLVLDREELLTLLIGALADQQGFENVNDVRIDLGDATLSLEDIKGLVVDLGAK
jgi:hypothetical protein